MFSPSIVKYSQRKCYKVTLSLENNKTFQTIPHFLQVHHLSSWCKGNKINSFLHLSHFEIHNLDVIL